MLYSIFIIYIREKKGERRSNKEIYKEQKVKTEKKEDERKRRRTHGIEERPTVTNEWLNPYRNRFFRLY
jgi:hypothetical protein